jgi:hypothetical protein
VAVIVRPSGPFGELIAVPATRRGVRERGRPVFAGFRPVRAVNLSAQRRYPVLLGGVEHPYVPDGIPFAAKAACPRRKIGVVRRADDDMAVSLHDRERHPTPRLQHARRRTWRGERQYRVTHERIGSIGANLGVASSSRMIVARRTLGREPNRSPSW